MEKLKLMPYAQATIHREINAVSLKSYETIVAAIIGGVLVVYGLHSMSTRRHISAFCKQFGVDYSIAKICYERACGFDIVTREFVAL